MKKVILFFLFLFLFSCVHTTQKEQINYCDDKESWEEWTALIKKYPNDQELQILHALRIGLCQKIKNKTVTFDDATEIFNKFQELVYKNAVEREKQQKENTKL